MTRVTTHWDDALERDGRLLVLCGNDVSLLSEVGAAAALAARDGIDLDALRDLLLARFGMPATGDVDAAVRTVVDALVQRGVATLD